MTNSGTKISNILVDASKYPDVESKQLKKLSKLVKFVFPESTMTLNKKPTQKIKFYEYEIIILLNPQSILTTDDIQQYKDFIKNKGHFLIFSQPSNPTVFNSLNLLLNDFNITLNIDQVIRSTYKQGYYHPKIAFVSDGVVNRALPLYFKRDKSDFQVVYPYGHTISCHFPSVPILGTGSHCYPVNRPICAIYSNNNTCNVIACGSFQILLDKYIDLADNYKFIEYLFQFLKSTISLNELDIRDPSISEYHHVPNIKQLSSLLQYGIEETDSVDVDVQKLYNKELFHLGTEHVSTIKQIYHSLQIPIEPLKLIPPEFQTPLPQLTLALFTPTMRTTQSAPLELYDLDEHCASDQERLGMLVNKCIYY